MRHLFIFLTVVCLSSCGGGGESAETAYSTPDVSAQGGVQRMSEYYYTDSVRHGGSLYTYNIVRLPADSLPEVVDTDGMRYVENTLSLTVTRNGQRIYAQAFTKGSVAAHVPADFLERSVIEGMAFNRATEEGLLFAISVGLPLSDEYVQLRLTVRPDGSSLLRRDEIVDENLADDDSMGV